jgi:glyceraldehyde 3-phosphate dehydrogenase
MSTRPVKIGINGFGRIGRLVLRALLQKQHDDPEHFSVDIVAINDLSTPDMLANLFQYDSIHGRFPGTVAVDNDTSELIFDDDRFKVLAIKDPEQLPWEELDADIVIECTGLFRDRKSLEKHLKAGAKKVILSAPAKTPSDVDITVVRGVNNSLLTKEHNLISNASCTTNCLAPVLKVLDDNYGVIQGVMTTIHAYTNDQRVLDSQHKDFRRSRAAMLSMIPTTTGAAKAIGLVMPHLQGKIDGMSVRVPTPNVSLVDLTVRLKTNTTKDELEQAYRDASDKETSELYNIIDYEWRSLVSIDFNHNKYSAVIDFPSLMVIDPTEGITGSLVKVLAWYDNEWAFSNRVAELVHELFHLNFS